MVHEMKSDLEGGLWRGLSSRVALTTFAMLLAGPVTLLAKPSGQTTFASPEDASRALLAAVQQPDERATVSRTHSSVSGSCRSIRKCTGWSRSPEA
jgi:hypothetical protein